MSQKEYSQKVLERFALPRNQGALAEFGGHARISGPCGDTMEFWLQVRGDALAHVTFETDGCGSSLAAGSMATELATGKTVEEALRINQQTILDALDGLPESHRHCGLLAAMTLKAAIGDFELRSGQTLGRRPAMQLAPAPAPEPAPEPAAEGCCHGSSGECQDHAHEQEPEELRLASRLSAIRHKVLVLSGKGGVGKSTVAVSLARALAEQGLRVGLLDVDIHGPSVPKMLGLESARLEVQGDVLIPPQAGNLKVMSIGFACEREDAVIWRGPLKMTMIKQFLGDVAWGELDYLIIDCPPGTGDEPLSVCQLVKGASGAVIVTTPQEVALADVRRSVNFCHKLNLPVLGVVENMSGFVCPKCGEAVNIFKKGGGQKMADEMTVPFLGRIPLDPQVVLAGDLGREHRLRRERRQSARPDDRHCERARP